MKTSYYFVVFILCSLLGLYLTTVLMTGKRFVNSVDRNEALLDSTKALSCENELLSSQVSQLKKDYFLLKVHLDSIFLANYELSPDERKPLNEASQAINNTIKESRGQATEKVVYDMLYISLSKHPTKEEYQVVLSDLVNKKLIIDEANNQLLTIDMITVQRLDSLTKSYCCK